MLEDKNEQQFDNRGFKNYRDIGAGRRGEVTEEGLPVEEPGYFPRGGGHYVKQKFLGRPFAKNA